MASGSGLLDIQNLCYSDLALDLAKINQHQLPQLQDHLYVRPLCEEAAKLVGQKSGIPVCIGHPDGAMNQLGSNALTPGRMTLSVGTSAAMRLTAQSCATEHLQGNWFYYAPEHWLEGAAVGATNNIDWFRNNLAPGMGFADLESKDGITLDSPVFLPFLYGESCPGWNDQNTVRFAELKGKHTIQDMYAAVQEGILHVLYQYYRNLCQVHDVPKRVLLSGGICKSERWMQMVADLFGREIEISTVEQASMLGGAVLAMRSTGFISNLESISDQPVGRCLKPNPDKLELYWLRHERYLYHYYQQQS